MRTRIVLLVAAMLAVLLPATSAQAAGSEIHVIDRDRYNGWWSEMAIAKDGNPMVASYNHSNFSVELSTCFNPECTRVKSGIIATGVPVADFDFAVGPDGLPVFVYTIRGLTLPGGFINVAKCSDEYCTGSKTNNQIWFSYLGDAGSVSLDVDASNNPTVVLSARTEWNSPWFTSLVSCGDPACTSGDRRVRSLGAGRGHDVAIGPNGLPVVVLSSVDAASQMTIERCLEARCKERKSEPVGSRAAHSPRVASDGQEITVVAVDRTGGVERAVCTTSKCLDPQTISRRLVRAVSPNVAYSRAGATVVSYTDSAQDGLWFSRCRSSCDRELLVDGDAGTTYTRVGVTARAGVGYASFYVPSETRLGLASVATY